MKLRDPEIAANILAGVITLLAVYGAFWYWEHIQTIVQQ